MLESMRRHARYFYVLFVLIIVTFIFWGVGSVEKSTQSVVVKIGKEQVSVEEYWRLYDRMSDVYREVYKEKFDEKMLEELKKTVLNTLIEERVLYVSALDSGLAVSDKELQDAIVTEDTFMRDGRFNREIYIRTLELNRMTPSYYEQMKRRELLVMKMKRLIEEAVDVPASEFKALASNSEIYEKLRQRALEAKKQAAVKSFVSGQMKQINVEINSQLIS